MKKLLVQMAVSEVNEDGTPGRFVTFKEEMREDQWRDWFERMGDGVKHVFDISGHCVVRFPANIKIVNKIQAIKAYREITRSGLKEAKDAVEHAAHRGAIWCESRRIADHIAVLYQRNAGHPVIVEPHGPWGSISDHGRYVFKTDSAYVAMMIADRL